MKLEKKKPFSFTSSSTSVSWLSKFSGMSIAAKDKKNTPSSSSFPCTKHQSNRCIHKNGNDLPAGRGNAAVGDFQTCKRSEFTSKMESCKKFEEMMTNVQRERDREKGTTMIMTPRIKFNRDKQKWERRDQMLLLEQKHYKSNADMKGKKSGRRRGSSNGGNLEALEVHDPSMNAGSESIPGHQWQKLKETKLKEVKLKAEQQRKSMYIKRELNSKVRIFSPRLSPRTEKCRVKAIEDLKKAKLRARENKERVPKGGITKESFAIVKCSHDPQKDFRDSMTEMIMENGISRPEELKELLVCYLTLNTDEYHDMIIKVFREVWSQLKHHSFDAK